MAKVSRHTQPAELGRCRRTQPADDPTGTGLEAEQPQTIRPVQASQQNNSQQTTLAGLSPCSAGWWRECGGAGHSEGGLRPTYLSPSHLSPLPVTVYTHSLNLYKPNLAPTYYLRKIFCGGYVLIAVYLFVCLSVCLSVIRITQKVLNRIA